MIQGRYPAYTSAFSGQDMDPHAEFPGDKIISGFLGPLLGPPSRIPNLPIVTWVQKRLSSLNKWSAKFDSLFTSNTRAFPVMPAQSLIKAVKSLSLRSCLRCTFPPEVSVSSLCCLFASSTHPYTLTYFSLCSYGFTIMPLTHFEYFVNTAM